MIFYNNINKEKSAVSSLKVFMNHSFRTINLKRLYCVYL